MRVLAVDPGFGRCGVAVLEKERGREQVLYSMCVETSAKMPFAGRLAIVVDACAKLMKEFSPDALALEHLYFSTNQKTAMHVAEVRGALMYIAQKNALSIHEYTPAQVKAATTGWGRSDKKAVATMVRSLLKFEKEIEHDDEYDAIAIGITHLAHNVKRLAP